jgi:ABC-2 type transport system ATP-binding protein
VLVGTSSPGTACAGESALPDEDPAHRKGRGSLDTVLMTSKLTKQFGRFTAVKDLDLEVREGEIYGFLGPNGAGKSTTIRMLLDLIRPSSGSARIFDQDVRKHGTRLRRLVGYLPGELALYENLSPRQFFQYSASLYGTQDVAYAYELAERLKVSNMDKPIGALSQGNKQKVGIVQALAHKPRLAILDEPTNALDPLIRHELYGILLAAKAEGTTVFFSSHVLAEAERICDRVAIIRDGRLIRVGTVDEMKALAPKRMRIIFGTAVSPEIFEHIPGVSTAQVNHVNGERVVELMVRSDLDEVVKIASHHPVEDFYSEAISLEDIFMGYYDTPAASGPAASNGPAATIGARHDGEQERAPAEVVAADARLKGNGRHDDA